MILSKFQIDHRGCARLRDRRRPSLGNSRKRAAQSRSRPPVQVRDGKPGWTSKAKWSLESQRAAAAEPAWTSLLKAAKTTGSTREAMPPGANAAIDTDDAAKAAMTRGRQLIKEGKFQEALDGYLTCYRELQAIRPGSSGCQGLMSAIKSLGRTYPAALVSLAGLRDSAMAQWQAQPDRRELPFENRVAQRLPWRRQSHTGALRFASPDDIQRGNPRDDRP